MTNQRNIFITGLGAISAIGVNCEENLESLNKELSGISRISLLDTIHSDIYPTAEIKISNTELSERLKQPEDASRNFLLGLHAAKEAFVSARLDSNLNNNIGLIGATTVGGMDITEKNYHKDNGNKNFILSHSGGAITEQIAKALQIKGQISTFNTACSSAANAIIYGANLIRAKKAEIVIAGGFDCLTKFTINGFKTLMILSEKKCTPFDKSRAGLNLGEGAGFIVLESEESMRKRSIPPLCKLIGYANANDAYHSTATSPEGNGAFYSMKRAIINAGIEAKDIDYINAHGTGTENNDSTEAHAIKRVFNNSIPPFSSTKAYTGHTLAAAGGIEAIFSILALLNDTIFPNLNFNSVMEETDIRPITEVTRNVPLKNVMSNSFGFGGNDSSLIFQKA